MKLTKSERTRGRESKGVASERRTELRAFLAGAAFLLAILVGAYGYGKNAVSQEETVEEPIVSGTIEDPERPEAAGDEVPVNWLPDLHIGAGAPETHVDLGVVTKKFCEQDTFKGLAAKDLEWEIEQVTNPAVAEVDIAGDDLNVKWNNGSTGKTKIVLKVSPKGDDDHKGYASFYAESWAPDYRALTLIFIGGLGLFLLGMKNMSDGLTAIAGSRLRRLISMFTNNRLLAVIVGVVTTTLVQSSTATSVMTLGFVNSGLMTLKQALGVIIGANVGTTTTGWLLTFNVGAYGLPILGIAAIFLIFFKSERTRNFATFAMGLGMIFFSLETLKTSMAPLADLPQFAETLRLFEANSMVNVGKCILVGCVTTFLVHSSAVTLALTMTLATLGSIDLNSSVAIVLGSNIGTTLTALFVSITTSANARRVAYFHLIFNLFGVLWVWAVFFSVLIPSIEAIGNAVGATTDVTKIALTNTIFNVANMFVFVPILTPVAKLLTRMVKEGPEPERKTTTNLTTFVNEEPVIGVERSRLEVHRMFLDCHTMAHMLITVHDANYEDRETIDDVFRLEEKLDNVQDETIDYISRMTTKAITSDLASSAREQVRLAEELETISDYFAGILKSNLKLKNAGLSLPPALCDKYSVFLGNTLKILDWLEKNFAQRNHVHLADQMGAWRKQYVEDVKDARDAFMQDMFAEKNDPLVIVAVEYQLNAWRRVYEHMLNIAEAMELPSGKPAAQVKREQKQAGGTV